MGHIKEKDLSNGNKRFYAEVQLKGFPRLTATFDRKSDAKGWIQKKETEMRCGENQLTAEASMSSKKPCNGIPKSKQSR